MTMEGRTIATYDDTGKIPVERIPSATIPIQVVEGAAGASAYQIAVANGFVGTEAEWLASLVGTPGQDATAVAHPSLAAHDSLGLATDAELGAHAATAHGLAAHAIDGAFHTGSEVLPTTGQKNALAGTSGTPGDLNRYVTTQDARLSDARPPTTHAHLDADIPAAIARDTEVTAAVAAHAGLADPHPGYLTPAEGGAAYEAAGAVAAHAGLANPHATYATDADLAAHAATPHGSGSAPVMCRKAADQAISAIAFADSTGMALAIAAAGTYAFEFHVYFTTNAATVGLRLGVNGPAQSALRFGIHEPVAAPAGAGSAILHSGAGAAYNTEPLAATAGPGTAPSYAILTGTLVATAAGVLQLRHGSETASATTILAGSWGRLTPIA